MNSEHVLRLVGKIYEAAENPTAWIEFLSDLAQVAKGSMAALVWHDPAQQQYGVVSHGMPEEYKALYSQYYGERDEWFKGAAGKIRVGWVGTGQMACSDEDLLKSEFYFDYLRRFDVFHQCGAILHQTEKANSSISLLRPRRKGPFGPEQLALLRILLQHLQRALQMQNHFLQLRNRNRALMIAIDQLNVGIVFLDKDGEALLFNRKADELLRDKCGLVFVQRKIGASNPRESSVLRAAIAGALRTGGGSVECTGGTVLLRREGKRPLSVAAFPLRSVSVGLNQDPAAVLFISDPDNKVEIPAEILRRCYGLTTAEIRLALCMAEGNSLVRAADSCGITYNTAKSQLKSVYAKTDARRQSELVRLLITISQASSAARRG